MGSKSAIIISIKAGIRGGYQSTNSCSPNWFALELTSLSWMSLCAQLYAHCFLQSLLRKEYEMSTKSMSPYALCNKEPLMLYCLIELKMYRHHKNFSTEISKSSASFLAVTLLMERCPRSILEMFCREKLPIFFPSFSCESL